MMKTILFYFLCSLSILTTVSCSKSEENKNPQDYLSEETHEEPESEGAIFQEGKGILLSNETQKAIGLELAEVKEETIQSDLLVTAQIYRTASETSRKHGRERSGFAYATAMLSPEMARQITQGQKVIFNLGEKDAPQEGIIWKLDETQLSLLEKIEILFELPDPKASLSVGDFIKIKISSTVASRKVLTIPNTAILEAATGTFAFVQNGDHLLRTETKIGTKGQNSSEIIDGLYEGDTIAVKPVQTLYLIELRATKGGGHSH
jgi:hypothetical protein